MFAKGDSGLKGLDDGTKPGTPACSIDCGDLDLGGVIKPLASEGGVAGGSLDFGGAGVPGLVDILILLFARARLNLSTASSSSVSTGALSKMRAEVSSFGRWLILVFS
jgi:hypothetical protein